MYPTLQADDVILYDTRPEQNLSFNDIVVLRSGVAHRLTWVDPLGGLWNTTDQSKATYARTKPEDYCGKVIAVIRAQEWLKVTPGKRSHFNLLLGFFKTFGEILGGERKAY